MPSSLWLGPHVTSGLVPEAGKTCSEAPIKSNPRMPRILIIWAAGCRECIEDCTAALDQLRSLKASGDAGDDSRARERQQAKLHARRASAHVATSNPEAAAADLQEVCCRTYPAACSCRGSL